eukprot:scaffold112665_cov69-Phaeocystis_antarctica.AAC.11
MVHGARSARRLARFVSMPDARNLEVITDDRPSGAAEFHLCAELARGRAPFIKGRAPWVTCTYDQCRTFA